MQTYVKEGRNVWKNIEYIFYRLRGSIGNIKLQRIPWRVPILFFGLFAHAILTSLLKIMLKIDLALKST